MVLAADYPFLDVLWTMIVFFLWISWFILLFRVVGDVFEEDDRAPVGDELTGELGGDRLSEELCSLDLLREHQRRLLRPRSRLVVALEGEEDDEPEHREACRQHAEDSRGSVAVGEAAARAHIAARAASPSPRERSLLR